METPKILIKVLNFAICCQLVVTSALITHMD